MDNTQPDDYRRRGYKARLRLSAPRKKRKGLNKQKKNRGVEWLSCQTDANKLVQKSRSPKGSLFGPDESWPEDRTKPSVSEKPVTKPATTTPEPIPPIPEPIESDDVEDYEIILEEIQPSSPEEKPIIDDIEVEAFTHDEKLVPDPFEKWVIKKQLCRCCLVEGTFDSLHTPAPDDDVTYDDMLKTSFNIELFPVSSDVTTPLRGVCGLCAARLRDAHAFRRQVIASEERFRDLYTRNCITGLGFEMDETENSEELLVEVTNSTKKRKTGNKARKQSGDEIVTAPKKPREKTQKRKCKPKGGRVPTNQFLWIDDAYKCTQCENTYTELTDLRTHFKKAHPTPLGNPYKLLKADGEFECIQCEKTFTEPFNFCVHLRKKHRRQLRRYAFKCSHCEKILETPTRLTIHKLKEHNIDERYKCGACDRAFNRRNDLEKHIDSFHMMGEKIKCSLCDYECYSQNSLRRHMVMHKTSKDFQCKYCQKSFLRKTTLTFHERIHTGDKQKQCAECGQAFVQKASLNYHMAKYHPSVKF